jgi:biopolymer transport protein ExbB/TolQ
MRARLLFLVIAILAVAGFAALNWSEVMRTTPLNFGIFVMDAAMGAILLTLLAIGLMAWLLSSTVLRSRMLITENRYTRDLQHQRDLADKAEASRFTELRQYLDSHFRENRQRDAVVTTEFEKTMLQSQRDLRAQMEQMSRALDTRLGQLESRFDGRVERTERVVDIPDRPVDPASRNRVKL